MFRRKNSYLIALFIIVTGFKMLSSGRQKPANGVVEYYQAGLKNLYSLVSAMELQVREKKSFAGLRQQFLAVRLVYKKWGVLIDYSDPFAARQLNGPPIPHIESEIADRILPPCGFQAVEDILYTREEEDETFGELDTLLNGMKNIFTRLLSEPDLEYKFRDETVWDAARSAIIQVVSLGITGADSPAAFNSIPEAAATLEGIRDLLHFYIQEGMVRDPEGWKHLASLLKEGINWLNNQHNFNRFDRLYFITHYMDPLYKQVVLCRENTGIAVPGGRSAVNYNATSVFSEDLLNINFYSPPEEYWVTPERVALGKKLFADPILSGNGSRSCASCHQPEKAFTDGLKVPYALDNISPLTRNTPTLLNSGFQTRQFYDSRADILENQLDEVVHNAKEMKGSLKKSVADLKASPVYTKMFALAYPHDKEPVNNFTIANAISSYVRSLRSMNSRFDRYMRGERSQLNKKEKDGFNLFAGKARCATCHFIPLFNGVVPPSFTETESEVLGVPESKKEKDAVLDPDPGKYLFTLSPVHRFAFKTPTLRNITLTAPYMHNGVYNTLEEVMDFYNKGGGKGLGIAPENQTLPFDSLGLTQKEIRAVIAFLGTLTDTSSRRNPLNH